MKGGNMINQKKAVSEIVSTVLIIMIAVAAVGIIGAIVVPMVRDNLEGGTACMNALSDIQIMTEGTCYSLGNESANEISNITLQVRKGSDEGVDLAALIVHVTDSIGDSIPHTEEINMSLGQTRVFTIQNVSHNATHVSVSPVVRVGNSEKQCDSAGQVRLRSC